MSHLAHESGQVLALTVLYLAVLVGMAALVIDAGAWFQTERRLQATADAAALAGAQALPRDPGGAVAVALEYARLNGGGVAAADVTLSSAVEPTDTISVKARAQAPGVFTRLFGIDSVKVGSAAAARAAPLGAARGAAPFAVSEQHPLLQCSPEPCFEQTTDLPLAELKSAGSSAAAGSFGLVNYAGATGPVGLPTLAEWVRHGYPETVAPGLYSAGTGAKFNAAEVRAALAERIGTEMLLPVYRTITGTGATAQFEIVAWVGFVLESFSGSGSTGNLRGRFTSVTWEGDPAGPTQPQFGARTLVLVQSTPTPRTLQRLVARRPSGERNGGPPRPRLRDRVGYRARTLGLAFAAALLALILTSAYVRSYKSSVDAGAAEVTVFVAARDIPAGTPASVLARRGYIERERIPRRLAVAGAVSTLAQLKRGVASERTVAGEQLTARRFEPAAAGGIRGDLNGTLRAIAVPGDANQLLTGLVKAGDRVDVVATSSASGAAGGSPVARVVLRELLVVRAPAAGGEGGIGGASGGGPGIVLALTDRQAQKLFFAIKHGQWALILRPHSRAAESPERVEDHSTVFGGEG